MGYLNSCKIRIGSVGNFISIASGWNEINHILQNKRIRLENLALIALLSMLYSTKNVLACANWNKEQSISIIENIVRLFTQTLKDLIADNLYFLIRRHI